MPVRPIMVAVILLVAGTGAAWLGGLGHSVLLTPPATDAASPVNERVTVPTPLWEVGDWWTLRVSNWRGGLVAEPAERMDWTEPHLEQYSVIRQEEVFGYDCLVLQKWIPVLKRAESLYTVRREDLSGVRSTSLASQPHERTVHGIQSPSPWLDVPLPVFPLVAGEERTWQTAPLLSADGEKIGISEVGEPRFYVWYRHSTQQVRVETWEVEGKALQVLRVSLSGEGLGVPRHVVLRWSPGRTWWVQAWWGPGLEGDWYYRAALAASSEDLVPTREVERVLPENCGQWQRDQLKPQNITPPLRGTFTNYHRVQTVSYQTSTGASLILWVLPSRFDDECVKNYEKATPAERRERNWPEPVFQGENYRVFVAEGGDQEEAVSLFQELKEHLSHYPRVVLEEYPLPKAAKGGKILE